MTVRNTAISSAFLDSVEGEISFFRSIMRARPVGIHRHFHVLAIRNAIYKDTGHLVSIDDIWEKLKTCYDLDALDAIVRNSALQRTR
jgi:MRG-binding protein